MTRAMLSRRVLRKKIVHAQHEKRWRIVIKEKAYEKVVAVAAFRSAVGKVPGLLNETDETDLLAQVFCETTKGAEGKIEACILGSGFPNERDNLCRKAWLRAGLPGEIDCTTVSKTCASSDEALSFAYQKIVSGKANAVLVGGSEKVGSSGYMLRFMKERVKRSAMGKLPYYHEIKDVIQENDMPYIAEMIAQKYSISRVDQDCYAIDSREKAHSAYESNKFQDEIVPIKLSNNDVFDKDELLEYDSDEELIHTEAPMFIADGSLTRYNAASMCDCAAAVLVMRESVAISMGMRPLVEVKDVAYIGVPNEKRGYAMKYCVEKILNENQLSKDSIDLYEINESFAAQAIAIVEALGIDKKQVNVNGGNLALGYPVGASGLRMIVTLIHEMKRSRAKWGISAMCAGGIMANATLLRLV